MKLILLSFQRRLRKELMSMVRDPPDGLKISDGSNNLSDDLSKYVHMCCMSTNVGLIQ